MKTALETTLTSVPEAGQWLLSGCIEKGDSVRTIPINDAPFRIGRRSEVDLRLPSRLVSGVHAEIVPAGDALFLRDLGSTNGTFVNGKRLKSDRLISDGDLIQFADVEFRVERCQPDLPNAEESSPDGTCVIDSCSNFESLWVISQFEKLTTEPGLWSHYQQILRMADDQPYGYEFLARSTIPGLESAYAIFQTSEQLGREVEISVHCRRQALEASSRLPGRPRIFMNTHPGEDLQQDVIPSLAKLREADPETPMVLEIHEASMTDPKAMRNFSDQLRDMNVELAYDDFGAGQARVRELIAVPPDYMKFDVGLIREIESATEQQLQTIRSLVDLIRSIGTAAVAEGIETAEAAQLCRELGFDYAQGYFYGRPFPVDEL